MLRISAAALLMTGMTACAEWKGEVSATEAELCRTWGASLATISRRDTDQTVAEVQAGYADFLAACPEFEGMIPQ